MRPTFESGEDAFLVVANDQTILYAGAGGSGQPLWSALADELYMATKFLCWSATT